MSTPGGFNVTLHQKTAKQDVYYTYSHGNDSSTTSYTLTTLRIGATQQHVVAKLVKSAIDTHATATCGNPPWLVTGFPGFKLVGCTSHDRAAFRMRKGL